jgi:glucokinase
MFIGTGLGGGWVRDGQVHEGRTGFAGEIGHIQIPGQAAPCACGQSGCLETVASKRGLERLLGQARSQGKPCLIEDGSSLRSKEIERAFREGCPSTTEAFHTMAKQLGWAMNTVAAILNPDVFVLGGGIADRLGTDLVPLIDAERRGAGFVAAHGPFEVVVGRLGPAAVAIGAAALR